MLVSESWMPLYGVCGEPQTIKTAFSDLWVQSAGRPSTVNLPTEMTLGRRNGLTGMEKETGIESAYIPIICDVMNAFNGPTKVVLVFPGFDST